MERINDKDSTVIGRSESLRKGEDSKIGLE